MTRAAWIAVGSVLCALLAVDGATLLAPGEPAVGMSGVGGGLLGGSLALAVATIGIVRRSPRWLAISGGAGLVAVRLVVGALQPAAEAPPLPASIEAAIAQVVSISTPSGGVQRAVISVVDTTPPTSGATDPAGTGTDARANRRSASRPPSHGELRLYARLPRYPEVVPGDVVRVSGPVRPPPEGTGFGEYLRRSDIAGTVTARTLDRVPAGGGPAAWLEAGRRDAGEILASVLPAPEAGLAAGILVGLRDEVDRDLAASFTAAGLTHIVAISGWNIAVVSGMLAALLRRAPRRRRSLVTVAAITAYTAAAGAGASVIRAAAMAAVVLGAREIGRPGTAASALGLAILAMLTVDPAVIGDAGFQLSVAATAGLLAWGTPLTSWLRGRLGRDGARIPAPGWLIDSLGVSLAAQAATLPLILLDFGRVSLIAPVANLVAAPLVVPVMTASAAALVIGWLGSLAGVLGAAAAGVAPTSGPGGPVGLVLSWVVGLAGAAGGLVIGTLVAVARLSGSVPGASVTLGPPVQHVLAVVSAASVAVIASPGSRSRIARRIGGLERARAQGFAPTPTPARGRSHAPERPRPAAQPPATRHRRVTGPAPAHGSGTGTAVSPWLRRGLLLAGCALAALVMVAASRPDGRMHLTVLDVGQGDAILLQGPSGGRVLVDAGPDPERLLPQLDGLVAAWDRRLDVLVLTHPHEDHVAGAALLLRRYRVGRIAQPGMAGNGPGWEALVETVAAQHGTLGTLAAGDSLRIDGVEIRVLWPRRGEVPQQPGKTGTAVNDVSIVLDVHYGTRRFLLTGDAEQEVDAAFLSDGTLSAAQPRVDVLKVAHHGSRTASTEAFLEAARPAVAIVSVGADNDYGHPAAATLERLRAAGARVFRTDRDGAVAASTNGRDLVVDTRGGTWHWREGGPSAAAALGPPVEPSGDEAARCIESTCGSFKGGSRRHPARARSAGLVHRTHRSGSRGRFVPRGAMRRARRAGRSRARRGRGPAARHRQAAARGRSGAGTRARGCRGTLAQPARLPGAQPGDLGASHHAAPRCGPLRALERRRDARRADRRVRGQACRPAPRGDERAVRWLGGAVPGAPREPRSRSCPRRATRA